MDMVKNDRQEALIVGSDATRQPLLVLRPSPQAMEYARKAAVKVNLAMIVLMVLCALLFGDGNLQTTLRYLKEYAIHLMTGAVVLGLLQLSTKRLGGPSRVCYRFYENRFVFEWPPREEEVRYEEICELRWLPTSADAWTEKVDAFCLYLRLKNDRELRVAGLPGVHQAWELLSTRFPEKVVDQTRATNQVSVEVLPLKTLARWFFLGGLWFLACFSLLSEKLAGVIGFLGLAIKPTLYLIRYHQHGRPTSEEPLALGCYVFIICCLLGAVVLAILD